MLRFSKKGDYHDYCRTFQMYYAHTAQITNRSGVTKIKTAKNNKWTPEAYVNHTDSTVKYKLIYSY